MNPFTVFPSNVFPVRSTPSPWPSDGSPCGSRPICGRLPAPVAPRDSRAVVARPVTPCVVGLVFMVLPFGLLVELNRFRPSAPCARSACAWIHVQLLGERADDAPEPRRSPAAGTDGQPHRAPCPPVGNVGTVWKRSTPACPPLGVGGCHSTFEGGGVAPSPRLEMRE